LGQINLFESKLHSGIVFEPSEYYQYYLLFFGYFVIEPKGIHN